MIDFSRIISDGALAWGGWAAVIFMFVGWFLLFMYMAYEDDWEFFGAAITTPPLIGAALVLCITIPILFLIILVIAGGATVGYVVRERATHVKKPDSE